MAAKKIEPVETPATEVEISFRGLRLALDALASPYGSAEDGSWAARKMGANTVSLHYTEGAEGKTSILLIPDTFTLPLAPQSDAE